MPEIVVAASMMRKTETKTSVRVLVNLSSLSEILRSACHQMSTDEVLIGERGERGERRDTLVQQYFCWVEPQQKTLTAVSSVSGQ